MIASEGWPFVLTPACAGTAMTVLGAPALGWTLIALAGLALVVFRAPMRTCSAAGEVVCAPADGRVRGVTPASRELSEQGLGLRLSIIPAATDPLVTRAPIAGRWDGSVGGVVLWRGAAGAVGLHHLPPGRPDPRTGADREVARGERIGLRRPRSTVDLYVPKTADLLVRAGDRVRAGATPVAALRRSP